MSHQPLCPSLYSSRRSPPPIPFPILEIKRFHTNQPDNTNQTHFSVYNNILSITPYQSITINHISPIVSHHSHLINLTFSITTANYHRNSVSPDKNEVILKNGNPISAAVIPSSLSSPASPSSPKRNSPSYDISNDENFIASARVDELQPLDVVRFKKLSNTIPPSNVIPLSPPSHRSSNHRSSNHHSSNHRSSNSSDDGDSDGAKDLDPTGQGRRKEGNFIWPILPIVP